MATRETAFIESIHRKLKKDAPDVHYVKFALRFVNGWPDAGYFAPNGATLWVEYKIHPNKPTAQQNKTIALLRSLGQKVAIITLRNDLAEVKTSLDPNHLITTPHPHLWIINALGPTKKCLAPPAPNDMMQNGPTPSTPH